MGDCGSNLLGLLLGATIVEGTLKTNALIALIGPLVILAVPFLDTTFVVLKRMKYRRPVYRADANHFHHRFARIGYSQRRTVAYLYAWTATMAGLAVALRFLPYSDGHGNFRLGWSLLMGALLLLGACRQRLPRLHARDPQAQALAHARRPSRAPPEHEIDAALERDLETGEFAARQADIALKRRSGSPTDVLVGEWRETGIRLATLRRLSPAAGGRQVNATATREFSTRISPSTSPCADRSSQLPFSLSRCWQSPQRLRRLHRRLRRAACVACSPTPTGRRSASSTRAWSSAGTR